MVMAGDHKPAAAQAIVLKPEAVMPQLTVSTPNTTILFLNGQTTVWHPASGAALMDAGSLDKITLALLTLRLVDTGVLKLDSSVSEFLPDVVPASAFEADIKVRHLLQETAGFASPPLKLERTDMRGQISHLALARFAIRQRSPAQASSHDPVSWAVLIAILEAATGRPLTDLMVQHIAHPLGFAEKDLAIRYASLSGDQMPMTLGLSQQATAAIARLLIRNRDNSNQLFLTYETYQDLVQGRGGFRLHPDGDIVSYGVVIKRRGKQGWLEPINSRCRNDFTLVAFPIEGAAFGAANLPENCGATNFRTAVLAIANDAFPGRVPRGTDGPPLARPSKLEGRYVLASRAPAALTERLDVLQESSLSVFGYTGDTLRARLNDGPVMLYRQTSAYRFEAAGADSQTSPPYPALTFSPFKLGGYVMVNDQMFRRADILASAGNLRDIMPWALLTVLTAGYYAVGARPKPWRRMGQFAVIGSALVGFGLYMEANYWAGMLYETGMPWLITLWRLGLNIGLMLVLSLPMFVLSFARKRSIPTSGLALLTAPHLALVAVSALTIFFTLVLWGVAGTFRPY